MKFRLILSAIAGVLLLASPAAAKKKVEPAKPALASFVNPDISQNPENVLLLDLSNGGAVAIRLMPEWAPHHIERIKVLARRGFYDGVIFHRVIEGFMAQTGDPTGTGSGGSELPDLKAEFSSMPHLRGTVSAARTNDPDSANSQFFIVFYPRFALDGKYSVLGRVVRGMDTVDRIALGEPPENPTRIVRATFARDDGPAAPTPESSDAFEESFPAGESGTSQPE
ncbi:MAG: peptidylprolyl isomerase [Sphingomonadaceae bacterium]|nr:peptidylprolyl isomerase [Sphingomonadaceae bacterium]